MRLKRIAGIIGLLGLIAGMASAVVSVSNLSVAQRPGTKLLDISYDVSSTETNEVTVSLAVSNGVSTVNAPSVTGDIGAGVTTGFGKSMVWDMGADWNEQMATLSCTVVADDTPIPPAPSGMSLIPAGSFQMGDSFGEGEARELPVHSVYVSAFYMDQTEVTKAQWDEVTTWATANGYSFSSGSGLGKAANHPVLMVSWYDCVKWANARSEKTGRTPCYTVGGNIYRTGGSIPDCNWTANGYRLPTEAEWEKAARGGAEGHRFPWSDSDEIQHARANYNSSSSYAYDTSPTRDYHPTYAAGGYPYTSPAGAFSPNGYGLVDMAGNVWEWCWDWLGSYTSSPDTDPRGVGTGSFRVGRGGGWGGSAIGCRVAYRYLDYPAIRYGDFGFRLAVSVGQ